MVTHFIRALIVIVIFALLYWLTLWVFSTMGIPVNIMIVRGVFVLLVLFAILYAIKGNWEGLWKGGP